MKDISKKLELARKSKGHSVIEACESIGISRQLWYAWKDGSVKKALLIYRKAAEQYIKGAS